jgi:hypothetical protein
MTILDDLNTIARGTTLATLAICVPMIALAILNRRKPRSARSFFKYFVLLAGLCWCGILGLSTLDNVSDALHSSVTGQVKVAGYQYGPRGTHISLYLACVADCDSTSVPLVMEPKAQSILRDRRGVPAFKIGYLVEAVKFGTDKAAFKVVDISDPSTGASFYHLDTSRHSWRVGILFADAALFLLTGLLVRLRL